MVDSFSAAMAIESIATAEFLPAGSFTGLHLPSLVPEAACRAIAAELDRRGFAAAGGGYPASYRDNDRAVLDDPELAAWLFARARARLPAELILDGARWQLDGLNPRFRACRYRDGQAFCIHRDGPYVPSDDRRSWLTLQLYLDDADELVGGRTRFYADAAGAETWAAIAPARGAAIAFDHRVWHDGEAVTGGTKRVLRTDVMYRRVAAAGIATSNEPGIVVGSHRGYVWRVLVRRDGSLVSSGRDGTVRSWPGSSVDLGDGSVTALADSARGQLWCGTRAGSLWTIDGGPRRRHQLDSAVLDLVALDNGDVVASLASGALVWIAPGGAIRGEIEVHAGWAWGLAARGDRVVSVGDDGWVVEVAADGRTRRLHRIDGPLRAVAVLAPDQLLVGDAAGSLHRLHGDRCERIAAHDAAVTAIAVIEPGRWLTAGEDGRVIAHHDGGASALVRTGDFVRSVVVLPDGGIAWAGYQGIVRRLPPA
jgi:hypothetical protein